MKRTVLAAAVVVGCAALVQGTDNPPGLSGNTTAPAEVRWDSSRTAGASTPTPAAASQSAASLTPVPPPPDDSTLTREERIRQHREKIERIIEENRRKQEEQREVARKAALQAPQSRVHNVGRQYFHGQSGWVIRVGEGLTERQQQYLLQQLRKDKFTPTVLPYGSTWDVLLPFNDDQASASKALARLQELGYQFGSVQFGRVLDYVEPIRTQRDDILTTAPFITGTAVPRLDQVITTSTASE